MLLTLGFFARLPTIRAGGPAGDSVIKVLCQGILPITSDCANQSLSTFETVVYDSNNNASYDSSDLVIAGPTPSTGATLVDDPKVMYRDTVPTGGNNVWDQGETIFYDTNGTLLGRVTLIGNPTASNTLIKHDPLIRIVDSDNNGALEGIVRITVRLENLGGINIDGSQEDVDAIQAIYTYDTSILKPMRVSYGATPGPVLPDQGRFTSLVRNHCTANGNPLDTVSPDEINGRMQTSTLCTTTNVDVGLGCDPATRDPTLQGTCPGDPATSGTTPLQNVDAVRVQFMILGHGNFALVNQADAPGNPGTKITDIEGVTQTRVPATLQDGYFDNRPGAPPPAARFTFTPANPITGQLVTFDGTNSTDIGGTIISYSWNFGDTNTATGAVVSHSYSQVGPYNVTLTVTDNTNLDGSVTHLVSVRSSNNPPVARFTVFPDQRLVNQSVTFDGTTSSDPDPGDSITSYDWIFGDGTFGAGSIVSHNYTSVGVYTIILTVTDTHGAQDTTGEQILVTRIPYLPGVHVGDWARYTYNANFSGTNMPTPILFDLNVTAVTGTNVTITVTGLFPNGTSTTQQQNIDIRNFAPFLTAANLTTGDPISILLPFTINGTITGTFVGATRNANYVSISSIGASTDAKWDQATGVLLHYNETFQLGPSQSSKIQFELVDTNIWAPSQNRPPVPIFTWNPQTAARISFNASRSYDPDPAGSITSYQWNFGDGQTGTGSTVTHAYTTRGNYTVILTLTDNNGGTASSKGTINVAAIPTITVTVGATPTRGIQPLAVTFTSTVAGGVGPYTYSWAFGDQTTSTDANPSHTFSTAGTYTVTLTVGDSQSLTATATTTITVLSPLIPSITATPLVGPPPLAVSFTGSATGGSGGYTFTWSFGDGGTGTGATASHTYNSPGSYTATLTVRDSDGHTGTSTTTIAATPVTGNLRIIVKDENGNPVSGALIIFTQVPSGQSPLPQKATQTDGSVLYQQIVPGNYAYTVTAGGYLNATKTETVPAGATPVQSTANITREPTPPASNFLLYAGIAAAAALIVLGSILYLRRRKPVPAQLTSAGQAKKQ